MLLEDYVLDKSLLVDSVSSTVDAKYLVLCVQLPTGEKELIVNTGNIANKVKYVVEAYNEDLTLKTNKNVKIIDWMVV